MPVLPGAEPFVHDGGRTGVLLCHGFTGTPQSLRHWAGSLADAGYSVRLPRLPGHGTTWQELNTTRWQDWYAAVQTAFVELSGRCEDVVVAGLSMGGALATQLAIDRAPSVAGLVLVNPAYTFSDPRLAVLPLIKHVLPSLPGIASDIALPGVTELAYDRTPLKALHSFVQAAGALVTALPQVTQPVLLMRSAVDHVVPAGSSATFLARVSSKDVTEIVLDDSFHVATLDHDAARIERESLEFVARIVA